MESAGGVSTRAMTMADVPAGLSLCRAAGWNQTSRDWEHFLTAAPRGALVAEERGVVVGTVATLPYGPFTWISMVLVDPRARGRGLGTMLLEGGLELIPEGSVARLDATPAGEPIYKRLGFSAEYGLARWFRDSAPSGAAPASAARPLRRNDWVALRQMDLAVFGASRADLLRRFADEAPEYAWVVEREGGLRGYVVGRRGHLRDQLGPLAADDDETAELLLQTCLAAHADRRVFIDVPDDRLAFRTALSNAGFAIERPFLRMYRGRLTAAGRPSLVYAIAGPEFG